VLQFVGILACQLALGGGEGAWAMFGTSELQAARESASSTELHRLARTAAGLDDAGVARFARERLADLPDAPRTNSTEASS